MLPPPPRPHQFILDPLVARTRGAPRKNEASTRRDPSAFERPVPARSSPSELGTLKEVIRHTETTTRTSMSPNGIPMTTTSISESQTAVYVSSSPGSRPSSSSDVSSLALDEPLDPQQPIWQPPSLEEFEEDIRRRERHPVLRQCNDPATLSNFLAETGQEDDRFELVLAREMALDTTGLYADCTPRMAWNYCFGDKRIFYAERSAQVNARNTLSNAVPTSNRGLKRAAPDDSKDMSIPHAKRQDRKRFLAQDAAAITTEAPKKRPRPKRCGTCRQKGHYSKTCKIGDGGPSTAQEEQAIADSLELEAESELELAEDAVIVVGTVKKRRQCGVCHRKGHNSRACQSRDK
jgi:hypothetical protein